MKRERRKEGTIRKDKEENVKNGHGEKKERKSKVGRKRDD